MARRGGRGGGSAFVLPIAWPSVASAQCVDEELKQELIGGRHYRGVQERLFTKAFRHELSVMGGCTPGLYSVNWLAGGAYTFHFSEDLALEASVQFTPLPQPRDRLVRAALPADPGRTAHRQARHGSTSATSSGRSPTASSAGWATAPAASTSTSRSAAASPTTRPSRGLTASAGLGTKLYFGKWFALRFDVRDHVLQEVLVGDEHLVNDVLVTLGASVFIPFGG